MSAARNLAGLGNQNTFAVETGPNEVGIASTAPSSTLDVRGEVKVGTNIQLGSAGVVTASSYSGSFPILDASSLAVSGISTLVRLAVTDEVVTGIITALGLSGNLTGAAATISGALNVDGTTDSTSVSTGALIVDGGVGIAKNVYIGAGLSVAGTLTYEDVTSVDSVGMVTAKSGVNITGGQFTVGSGITMGIAGVATFSGTSDVHLVDTVQLKMGDSSDFQLYHNGVDNYIIGTTGDTVIRAADEVKLQAYSGSEDMLVADANSSVKIYYDGSEKFRTTNDGVVITGLTTCDGLRMGDDERIKIGDSEDLQIYHHSSHDSYISNGTGFLALRSTEDVRLTSDGNELMVKGIVDGAVEVYYDNSKKFETTNDGTVTTGIGTFTNGVVIPDSKKLLFGNLAGGDCQIIHDGTDTFIQNKTGDLKIANNVAGDVGGDIIIQAMNSENSINCVHDAQVELSYNGTKKIETTNEGAKITGFTSTTAGMGVTGGLFEGAWIKAGKLSDNKTLGISTANVFYFTTQESTTATPDIRWNDSYTLSSKMAVGDVASVTVITTAAAGGYSANWTIDGTAVTEEWVGGSAPSAGGSDGLDIYSLTIIKTGTGTGNGGFKLIANLTNAT